jgi:hypothetical protein
MKRMDASATGVAVAMRVFAFVGAGPIALTAINARLTYGAPYQSPIRRLSMPALGLGHVQADVCFGPIADISSKYSDAFFLTCHHVQHRQEHSMDQCDDEQ